MSSSSLATRCTPAAVFAATFGSQKKPSPYSRPLSLVHVSLIFRVYTYTHYSLKLGRFSPTKWAMLVNPAVSCTHPPRQPLMFSHPISSHPIRTAMPSPSHTQTATTTHTPSTPSRVRRPIVRPRRLRRRNPIVSWVSPPSPSSTTNLCTEMRTAVSILLFPFPFPALNRSLIPLVRLLTKISFLPSSLPYRLRPRLHPH